MGLLFFRQALVSRGFNHPGAFALRWSLPTGLSRFRGEIPRFTAFYNGLSTVKKGPFSILNSPFEQINYGLFSRILDFLQTRNGDRKSGLPDREFRRSKGLRRADIKRLI